MKHFIPSSPNLPAYKVSVGVGNTHTEKKKLSLRGKM